MAAPMLRPFSIPARRGRELVYDCPHAHAGSAGQQRSYDAFAGSARYDSAGYKTHHGERQSAGRRAFGTNRAAGELLPGRDRWLSMGEWKRLSFFEAKDEPARSVLKRLFRAGAVNQPDRDYWLQRCDPLPSQWCFIHLVHLPPAR